MGSGKGLTFPGPFTSNRGKHRVGVRSMKRAAT